MDPLFDHMADSYDAWYNTAAGRIMHRIEKEAVYAYLEPREGMELLDIGCGTGQYSLELAAGGVHITGVDISPAMLDRARAKTAEAGLTAHFIEADACRLPFKDKTFDAVLSVTALEFAPNLFAPLQEGFRVLKPGGRSVVGIIGRNSAWWRFYTEKARQDPASIFNHAHFFTLDELLAAMPGSKVQGKAVLFVPPDFDFNKEEEAMTVETAAVRAGRSDGGFICAVSKK